MTVEEIGIYTVADLEPERERDRDERLRWELLEGELVMTPAPRYAHQHAVGGLFARLLDAVDPAGDVDVVMAPFDVHLSVGDLLQPDLVVVPRSQIQEAGVNGAPLLAVEVLLPSTRRRDLVTKLEILQRAGCPHYWVVDPDGPRLWAWRLVEGSYVLEVQAEGEDEVRFTEPVQLSLRVADLVPPT